MKKISFISIIFIIYLTIIGMIVSSKISIKQEEAVFKKIDISIDAESCIVMNSKNEIIYAKNEHKKLLPASITKILTCLTSLKLYPLDHYVYITYDMVNTIGSKIYLKEGDFIKIEDLLYGLMLSSGNDASKALELALSNNSNDFIYYMNKFAKEIGMKNSYFNNSSGLDNESLNYTTSYDMAVLTNYAIKYNSFVKIFGAKKHTARLTDRMLYFRHKHRLVHNIPNILGGKTGYTEKAGRTLVTTFDYGTDTLTVVTFNSHNDWKIHEYFNEYYKTNFLPNSNGKYKNSLIKASYKRLRSEIDD